MKPSRRGGKKTGRGATPGQRGSARSLVDGSVGQSDVNGKGTIEDASQGEGKVTVIP